MLQINTGKLFTRGVGYKNDLRGVLYSNGQFSYEDLETSAGTLRATRGERGSLAVVFEIKELIEKDKEGPGLIVSHGITPYLRDFATLASFGLEIIVSLDEYIVRRLTDENIGFASSSPPKEFIKRFFDRQVVPSLGERNNFKNFVKDLLGLERRKFLAAMRAIKTYVAALHSIPDDLGLSYTLLVSAVETLVQDFDGFEPTWRDVEERKRRALDAALYGAPEATAEAVRTAFIRVEHIAMRRRYQDFVMSKIEPSYFRDSSITVDLAASRHHLPQALQQAYGLRSQYIHSAKPLPDALTSPYGYREVADVDRKPVLTLEGLARITRHAIRKFVAEEPKVESEVYDYGLERAGIIVVPLAPELWISQPLTDARQARERLEGFLSQIAAIERGDENAQITDLRSMLGGVEKIFNNAPASEKPTLYVLYVAFNGIVPEHCRMPEWKAFMERYAEIGDEPYSDVLIARTIFDTLNEWPIEIHQKAYDQYWEERKTKAGLHAPRLIEAAAALALAERYRQEGQEDCCRGLIAQAVECHPGHRNLLDFESRLDINMPIKWRKILTSMPGEEQA